MTYHTGPSFGNDWVTMFETVKGHIEAHPAWEFIETHTYSSSARFDVYRCLGTVNSLGADFYVVFARRGTQGHVGFAVAESYDAATDTVTKFAPQNDGATALPLAADGTYDHAGVVLTAGAVGLGGNVVGNAHLGGVNVTSSAYGEVHTAAGAWHLVVANSNLVLVPSSMPGSVGGVAPIYVGVFESMVPDVDPVALCVGSPGGGNFSSLVNSPGTNTNNRTFATTRELVGFPAINGNFMYETAISGPHDPAYDVDRLGRRPLHPILLTSFAPQQYLIRGMLSPNLILGSVWNTMEQLEDTVAVNGNTYIAVQLAGSIWGATWANLAGSNPYGTLWLNTAA